MIVPPTGHDRKGHERRHQRDNGGDPVHELVGVGGEHRLLKEQLDAVGERLQPAERARSVRPPAGPEPSYRLALVHDHEEHREHQKGKHRNELDQQDHPDDEVEALCEERVSRVGRSGVHGPSSVPEADVGDEERTRRSVPGTPSGEVEGQHSDPDRDGRVSHSGYYDACRRWELTRTWVAGSIPKRARSSGLSAQLERRVKRRQRGRALDECSAVPHRPAHHKAERPFAACPANGLGGRRCGWLACAPPWPQLHSWRGREQGGGGVGRRTCRPASTRGRCRRPGGTGWVSAEAMPGSAMGSSGSGASSVCLGALSSPSGTTTPLRPLERLEEGLSRRPGAAARRSRSRPKVSSSELAPRSPPRCLASSTAIIQSGRACRGRSLFAQAR